MDSLIEKYPRFAENKILNRRPRVFTLIKRPDACYYYRILVPQQQLVRQFGWDCKFNTIDPLPNHVQMGIPATIDPLDSGQSFKNLLDCHMEDLEWSDIIVMQRPTCEHHLELLRYIKKHLKKPVFFEADDNYLDVPVHNNGYAYFKPRAEYIKNMIRECDGLIVTTQGLSDIYRPFQKNIFICPNSIDFEYLDNAPTTMLEYEVKDKRKYFNAMKQIILNADDSSYKENVRASLMGMCKQKRIEFTEDILNKFYDDKADVRISIPDEEYSSKTDGKVVIGWTGSPTHREDLATVTNPLMDIFSEDENLVLTMGGFIHNDWLQRLNRNQLWLIGLVPVKYYYSMLKQCNFSIGLAPVNRDRFNLGKSNLKVIEYCALGVYAIATDYETYKGVGEGVPLCKREEEWSKALREAINDEAMRFEVALKNREYVESNYDIKENVKYWKESYESVL